MISAGSVFIVRLDSERTCGWQVRLYREKEKYHSKLFSDSVWGGKRKARAAAEKYQDECLDTVAEKVRKRQKQAARYGCAWGKGVNLRTRQRWDRPNCPIERFWFATYWDKKQGVQKRRYFSVAKYGYRAGKKLAEHFRATGILKAAKFGEAAKA